MNRARQIVRRGGGILLGTFVLGQAMFLVAALVSNVDQALGAPLTRQRVSITALIPESNTPSGDLFRTVQTIDRDGFTHYGELTGQPQEWGLFAPDISDRFAFLVVELRWDDDSLEPGSVAVHDYPAVKLPSENAPADVNRFIRFQNFRLRRCEMHLVPPTTTPDVFFDTADVELIYEEASAMHAYLHFRLAAYRREHPELPPPSQVRLWLHKYRIPPPPGPEPWHFEEDGWECVGCWLPDADKER
jgi:hypothetical protein